MSTERAKKTRTNYTPRDHTFVVLAYKENKYLENCIRSALKQTAPSRVIVSTSTPNEHIHNLAQKYDLPLAINTGAKGLFNDFNFACSSAPTKLVTLCHQDDYYYPEYIETALDLANKSKKMLIFFSEYGEIRKDQRVTKNKLLRVKRIMNSPLRIRALWGSKWTRRRILSLGSSICCPSVMFNKEAVGEKPFFTEYSNSGDWKTWGDLSKLKGDFVYCPERLMDHRIWKGSETTRLIANREREREDYEILCEFWPKRIASLVLKLYSQAEKSNG